MSMFRGVIHNENGHVDLSDINDHFITIISFTILKVAQHGTFQKHQKQSLKTPRMVPVVYLFLKADFNLHLTWTIYLTATILVGG